MIAVTDVIELCVRAGHRYLRFAEPRLEIIIPLLRASAFCERICVDQKYYGNVDNANIHRC